VPIAAPTIPSPPESGVRLVEQPIEETVDFSEKIEEIDRERLFDLKIRSLLGICLRIDDVLQMSYYVTLREFLARCTWKAGALNQARVVNGVVLWTQSFSSTREGEEVWCRFRLRIRREGAHRRIINGTIGGQADFATLRSIRPRTRSAA
jgi:hypothetical protein